MFSQFCFFCLLLSVFGFFGMTLLFPIISAVLYVFNSGLSFLFKIFEIVQHSGKLVVPKLTNKAEAECYETKKSVTICVPAYNEEHVITQTLLSIVHAKKFAQIKNCDLKVTIQVLSDGSTDRTVEIAKQTADIVIQNEQKYGKWQNIVNATNLSSADFIFFVDAGTIWETNTLDSLLSVLLNKEVLGVCPSYMPAQPSSIQKLLWNTEKIIKTIENMSGGPISFHGATVGYNREYLKNTLDTLTGEAWINDDVVIPLSLRYLNPHKKIVYLPEHQITDLGVGILNSDFTRRKRLLLGNIQWIKNLPWYCTTSTLLLSARRVFRVFWSVWLLLLLIGLFYFINFKGLLLIYLPLTTVLWKIKHAFLISLLSPYLILNSQKKQIEWNS
jgi:cellulose synthase/poly-beta-1,6-N-acetylglucosamine synthase-like glycosyltransferase